MKIWVMGLCGHHNYLFNQLLNKYHYMHARGLWYGFSWEVSTIIYLT